MRVNKQPAYNLLFDRVRKSAAAFNDIYILEKKKPAAGKRDASEEYKYSLRVFINNLIHLGESYPVELATDHLKEAVSFSESPIFLGGVHKSGTTLLRNLLDGHNELAVLPLDGPGVLFFERSINDEGKNCHREILQRILPIFIAHPSGLSEVGDWVLSGGEYDTAPYITFVRNYYTWISKFGVSTKGVFQALACSFLETVCPEDITKKKFWVHKCTLNVDDAVKLASLFPEAIFLHIVRHPCAIYASQRRKEPLIKKRDCSPDYELDRLYKGFGDGIKNVKNIGADRYHFIQYEDLVSDPKRVMGRVIAFLELDFKDTISLTPSVMGKAVKSNTAYDDAGNHAGLVSRFSIGTWKNKLNRDEINVITASLKEFMPFYGYETGVISFPNFILSILRLELKYLQEEGVKPMSMSMILRLLARLPDKKPHKKRLEI